MRPISKFPFALLVSAVLGQLLPSGTSTDISSDISTNIPTDIPTDLPTDPLTEPSISTSTTTDELIDDDSSTASSSSSTTDPGDLIVSETSSDSSLISTETPAVTTDDLSTPSPTDSLQAASTIPGDLYLADEDAEPEFKAKEPSPDEVVDLAAYEVDAYAQRLAAGQQSIPEVPDPEAQVVLPVCPDVSASAKRLAKRQGSQPVFGCSPERLSIRVHFVHVAPGFYLSDKPLEDVKQRAITNFAFLRDVMARLGIDMFFGSYTSDINPAFSDNQFGDSPANIKYRTKTRKGDSDSLTVWIVDNITDPADPNNGNPGGYSSFPNDGGSGPTAYDGLVVQQVSLSPLNQKSLADAVYTIEAKKQCTLTGEKDLLRIQGSTLIHEFGHWMGLIHTHEGGCSGTGDRVADTNQVADSTTRSCCYQATCNKVASFRVKNWMSYSSCRGISLKGNPFFYDAFTEGQRSRMFSHFLKYRQRRNCNAPQKRDIGSLPTSTEETAVLRKRDEQGAMVMADLLLNNCSVAIQDVFEPDSIPLDQKVLESYSSQASSLRANPTSLPPGVERPPTLTGATAQPTETGEGDSAGEEDDDSGAMAGVSFNSRGSMVSCIAWVAWFLFG